MEATELESLAGESSVLSERSSLDQRYFRGHICDVYIWDDKDPDYAPRDGLEQSHYTIQSTFKHANPCDRSQNATIDNLPVDLRTRLGDSVPGRTRWINVVGWSESLMSYLAQTYLSDHGCLDLDGPSQTMMGGPVPNHDGQEFIWLHTKVWFLGPRLPNWSSIAEIGFCMVVVIPKGDS